MPKGKSAGHDDILPEFISHLGGKARATVLKFMNKVWELGIPSSWRKADILPIPKKGKLANKPENCRPIALTSMFSKLYERLLLSRLQTFLQKRRVIADQQAGFRRHRNTVEQVAYLSQEIKNGFHRKQSTVAVFVDLKDAFDKVWRERLMQKIRDIGIAGNMYKSICSFMAQRFIRVKYNGAVSPYKQTKKGVPQGAVLSPILFSLMINDVVATLEAIPGIRTLLYADDLVVWATSSNIKAIESCLNLAMDALGQWTIENDLEVNTAKTEYQIFSLSTKPQAVEIKYNNEILPKTDSATYLGIRLDGKLNWRKHIDKLVQQGEGRLALLKRLAGIKWGANQDLLTMTYKSYIRPTMEYGHEILLTATDSSLKNLDVTQNKALRLIIGAAKSTPIAAMEIQTGIEPLQIRREAAAIGLYERVKRLNIHHWDKQETSNQRLKSQKQMTNKVQEILEARGLDLRNRQPFDKSNEQLQHVGEARLALTQLVSKEQTPDWEMKAVALETIHCRYPEQSWLHVFTDGSALSALQNAGAGVYCREFQLSAPVGKRCTNFDGEVAAIRMALEHVEEVMNHPQVVLFIDSQAAIVAICSGGCSDHGDVSKCRRSINRLIQKGIRVVLQWVPGHCGLLGNEQADLLARGGAEMLQPDPPLPYSAARRIVKAHYKEEANRMHLTQAQGKRWQGLMEKKVPPTGNRREAVAWFRLLTGHDYLQRHLHRIGVVDSPLCPLCHEDEMDMDHLPLCPELTDVVSHDMNASSIDIYKDEAAMAKLYWAARSRMA